MQELARFALKESGIAKTLAAVEAGGCPALITGLGAVHRAHAAAALWLESGAPVICVCADETAANAMAADLAAFTQREVPVLTAREFTLYDAEGVSRQTEQAGLRALWALLTDERPLAVVTAAGLMERRMPPAVLKERSFTVSIGGELTPEDAASRLAAAGYRRAEQVEGPGQFAIRGGIIDFFSPAYPDPVRCELFGDEVDSVGFFDADTQRRVEMVKSAVVIPAAETLIGDAAELMDKLEDIYSKAAHRKAAGKFAESLARDMARLRDSGQLPAADRYMELIYPFATVFDYLPPDAVLFMCEPAAAAEETKNFLSAIGEDMKALKESGTLDAALARFSLTQDEQLAALGEFPVIMADNFTHGRYPLEPRSIAAVTAKQLPSYGGSLDTAAGDISHYLREGYRVVAVCRDRRRTDALAEFLSDRGIPRAIDPALEHMPEPGTCAVTTAPLTSGFEYPAVKLAVITEGKIIARSAAKRKKRKTVGRERIETFSDLSPGELVVHEQYGIGRFVGFVKREIDGAQKEYIKIAYAGTDMLYVPATSLDLVSKYIGAGADTENVKLSKLGGGEWTRAKSRAKHAARELAASLIALQAQRMRECGTAFSPDTVWQREFEDSFEYTETDDQMRCVEEIKRDMEKPVPMDRLLCGDVGYGKTEVALRAVMKCVMDGMQAAILVPTTVLAQQHYQTCIKRFSDYPVSIEVLNRFRSAAQLKRAAAAIEDGSADIVIGTHKLLQKSIKFKKLGLLIIDEEQRFGVTHKEKLKELFKGVDVLTLSATPIPRTLNMALSGIRDMSSIEEPPQDRRPVQTFVMEHDWNVVCEAIRRELDRGGQVYYLHNRIETIERTAAKLRDMLDGPTVAVAHGRMDEEELSAAMERVISGEVQVLVCTTIIETGIDIPNVNTLIIEDADRLGLAQLHQIRGRVGRSPRRAFAYLTFRPGKVLTEVAEKRLSAMREFAEFNSGFRIAMRDLEIRGAGDFLGAQQSGHMINVGYDMYMKLLGEAVLEEKGETPRPRVECSADISVSAHIPEKYVPAAEQRMDLYRRIALITSEEELDDVADEITDRFGEMPASVDALLKVALLRADAARAGITEISQRRDTLRFTLRDAQPEQFAALYASKDYKDITRIEGSKAPRISLHLLPGRDALAEAARFVRFFAQTAEKC